jgi:hypothetical protein
MKTALLTIALTLASGAAFADGFNPWDHRNVQADSISKAADVRVSSFYSKGLPSKDGERHDAVQVAITITPYDLLNS